VAYFKMIRLTGRNGWRLQRIQLRCASTAIPKPYEEYKAIMTKAQKEYPGIFISEAQEVQMRTQVINKMWDPKTLEASVNAYNASYDNLWDNHRLNTIEWGRYERAPRLLKESFKSLDYEILLERKPTPTPFPREDWAHMDMKMKDAQVYLEDLQSQGGYDPENFYNYGERKHADKNLAWIRRENTKGEMRNWLNMIWQPDELAFTTSGLPINNIEMNNLWLQVRHERMKDFWQKEPAEKTAKIKEIVTETWDRMWDDCAQFNQPDRTKADFEALRAQYFKMFNPEDFSHYTFLDASKTMYMMAFWQGGEKLCEELVAETEKFLDLWHNGSPDLVELWKECYRQAPECDLAAENALMVKAIDTGFINRLISQIRIQHAELNFQRAAIQIMGAVYKEDLDCRLKYFERERETLETAEEQIKYLKSHFGPEYAEKAEGLNFRDRTISKQIKDLTAEYNAVTGIPELTVEESIRYNVLRDLWCNEGDTSERAKKCQAFADKFVQYAKTGKGDVLALEAEAKALLPDNLVTNQNAISNEQYLKTFVNYIKSKSKRTDLWSLSTLFWSHEDGGPGLKLKRRSIHSIMKKNFHDVMVRVIMHQLECKDAYQIERILLDFQGIIQRQKGEIYGSVVSAKVLSDAQFKNILDNLQKQNPGKQFFLEQSVDASLQSGFVVKCGIDRLDYSLNAEVGNLKKKFSR